MKKLLYLAAMMLSLTMFASCEKEEIITESELPGASREFLQTHFAGVAIASIVKETEGLDKDYSVYLSNGFQVDFTKSGAWDEVDGQINPLPQSVLDLLPVGISQYIGSNFPTNQIVSVNKEHFGYEIELDSRFELAFDASGNFLRIDD
jgi:hypothetical protein